MCKRSIVLGFLFGLASPFLNADTLSISANPSAFTINTAVAGQQPDPLINISTTYNFTTSALLKKRITGKVNSALPAGVTLQLQLTAPSGASSAGAVTLTTTAQNLVTGIPPNATGTGLTMTYTLTGTVNASKVTNANRNITLSIIQ